MRLLLMGAFPYPHDQGSQVYFQEQAIALRQAGADPTLLTYGPAVPFVADRSGRTSIEHWRALDGFEHRTPPSWTSPRSLRSGPNWGKPLADLGLAMTLRDAIASRASSNDAYDAILTHNAEAASIALRALPRRRPPIVYCAHTLLGQELSSYFKYPDSLRFLAAPKRSNEPSDRSGPLDRIGDAIDRWVGRHADGWIALTHSAACVMKSCSQAPGALIPPPVPDPAEARAALDPEGVLEPAAIARQYHLEPGGFFLYSGNLDAYQDLDCLAEAARRLAEGGGTPPPIVVARHRRPGAAREAAARRLAASPGLILLSVASAAEMRALLAAARASLVTRRRPGGFPIKLVNSLAVGTPPIAFLEREWGLAHERDSLVCPTDRPAARLAEAIDRLARDDGLARRLASGARTLYLARHLPERAAARTIALVEEVRASRRS